MCFRLDPNNPQTKHPCRLNDINSTEKEMAILTDGETRLQGDKTEEKEPDAPVSKSTLGDKSSGSRVSLSDKRFEYNIVPSKHGYEEKDVKEKIQNAQMRLKKEAELDKIDRDILDKIFLEEFGEKLIWEA